MRQPGDLGVLRGVNDGFSEEARTRGFAPLTLVRFAFSRPEYCDRRGNPVNSGMYLERLLRVISGNYNANQANGSARPLADLFGLAFQPF